MEKNKIVLGKRYNRLIPIEKINKKDKNCRWIKNGRTGIKQEKYYKNKI